METTILGIDHSRDELLEHSADDLLTSSEPENRENVLKHPVFCYQPVSFLESLVYCGS